jgi:hypothetical protein
LPELSKAKSFSGKSEKEVRDNKKAETKQSAFLLSLTLKRNDMNKEIYIQQQKVGLLANRLKQEQQNLLKLQKNYLLSYKLKKIRYYLNQFTKIPIYKHDPELVSVIFNLANLEEGQTIKTILTDHEINISYFNKRLNQWVKI